MNNAILTIALMGLIIAPTGCVTNQRGFPPKDQITNYDRVDAFVTRGAQPNAAGFEALAKDGTTMVINLRNDPWSDEKRVVESLGMTYVNVKMSGTSAPKPEDIATVLELIRMVKEKGGKVFTHCQFGCDRTGTAIACYRITQGMSNKDALDDAKFHGISKLLPHFHHYITHYKP